MLLFKKAFWDGLQTGAITLTFRRWAKPHVKPGGRYRCHPIGVLEVDAIAKVTASGITEDDARRAGFPSRDVLRNYLVELGPIEDATELWRVELHHGGDGDLTQSFEVGYEISPRGRAYLAARGRRRAATSPTEKQSRDHRT